MNRSVLTVAAVACSLCMDAQMEVPVRVVLDATDPANRHVQGLAEPTSRTSGVSLEAARTLSTAWAYGTGTSILTADLVPAPSTYVAGMTVTVVPDSANATAVQMDLNGLGPRPIRAMDGNPLDNGTLMPDLPARFAYDGAVFILLSEMPIPCRSGYRPVSIDLCIETQSHDSATFFEAVEACNAQGARLCRYGEWITSCRSTTGFMTTVPEAEWVDSAANNANNAKTVGVGFDGQTLIPGAGCGYGSTVPASGYARYRCCSNR